MRTLILRALLALAVAAATGGLLAIVPDVPAEGKEYEITDARVSVVLQEDGSLLVHESLPFDFTGSFTGAYRDIPLNGEAEITGISVASGEKRYRPGGNTALGSFDLPGTFGTETFRGTSDFEGASDSGDPASFQRVVWHYNAADEVRTFDLTYRVTGATNVRDDVVDVTWTVWGDQWAFWLDHLDADISAASGVAPTQAWLRPRALGTDATVGETAEASIDRLAEGQNVGLRAVFPRDAISSTTGAEVDRGAGLAEIEAEEAGLDDGYGFIDRLKNGVSENALAISIVLGLLGLLGTVLLCLRARENPTETPEYLPEPPEELPPALAYAYANEGAYDERVVLATLLDLVDRGYYEARPAPGDELDLELRIAENRPERDGRELAKYEVTALDFFDRLLGAKWIAIGKMKDGVPKHSTAWHSRWENLNEQLGDAERGSLNWDLDLRSWRAALMLAVAAAFVAVIVLAYARTHRVAVPVTGLIATLGLMLAPPSDWLRRQQAASRQRHAQWRAFDHWTHDFPRLHDDPPATLQLWRRILVYAVAFGTAERVAKSGRIPAPVAEEAGASGLWTSYAFTAGSFGGSFDGFSSGFSSQVAPESTSSGGGGFSGGGGGGFSGGGGGGAW